MPAAAVIPAPVAYINVVAVKKLVVGFLVDMRGPLRFMRREFIAACRLSYSFAFSSSGGEVDGFVYFEKIRVFKAGVFALNTLAWNNNIGLRSFYFVGFWN